MTNISQAFPCEVDDGACLHCELTDNSYLEIGVDDEEVDSFPVAYLSLSQVENLIEYLSKVRDSLNA
jgi:hypothetical protein